MTALYLISDFNIEIFERYLSNTEGYTVEHAPFGQVYQALASEPPDPKSAAIIWTRPEGVLPGFARVLDFEVVSHDQVLDEVWAFAERIRAYAKRVRALLVPTWVLPAETRGYGMLDLRPGIGQASLLAKANTLLAEALSSEVNVFVLDAERWARAAGSRFSAPKLWYASKVPFSNQFFQDAAAEVRAALEGISGHSRKLILLDLDDTLWGEVVGEAGWQGLILGGHDHVGEAFVDFQRALKGLSRRGVQLGIVSKNESSVALEAIDRHPEMALRRSDFAAWRINWADKAENVVEICRELNLGLDSVVFIDNSAAERGRVREALPAVLVPDWPADPAMYRATLLGLRCFDTAGLSAEDRDRTKMYAADRDRRDAQKAAGSLDEWIGTLGLQVGAEALTDANLARAAQLFNKTNQMNLATRRMTQPELKEWSARDNHLVLTFRVSDRFGDAGLTGLLGLAFERGVATIVDFILSCRVMGRHIEETMLHVAVSIAHRRGCGKIVADYAPTERNGPCLSFWRQSRFRAAANTRFVWSSAEEYPLPAGIALALSEASALAPGLP